MAYQSSDICPKVNVIAQMEFELAYYNSAVQRFNYYAFAQSAGAVEYTDCFSAEG